jgi:hypothetical protein
VPLEWFALSTFDDRDASRHFLFASFARVKFNPDVESGFLACSCRTPKARWWLFGRAK